MTANETQSTNETHKRRMRGTVVSTAMEKTAVVQVERYERHPKYDKYVQHRKRYKAHDEEGSHAVGDEVTIEECVPVSKQKRFRIVSQ